MPPFWQSELLVQSLNVSNSSEQLALLLQQCLVSKVSLSVSVSLSLCVSVCLSVCLSVSLSLHSLTLTDHIYIIDTSIVFNILVPATGIIDHFPVCCILSVKTVKPVLSIQS